MYCELRADILCSKRARRRRAVTNLLVHRQRLYAPISFHGLGLGSIAPTALSPTMCATPSRL